MTPQDRLCCAHLGGIPSHLPSSVGPHIPAGPAEGRHLRESIGGPGGPPALTCSVVPGPGESSRTGGVRVPPHLTGPCPSPQYFILLLIIFLLEIIAGVLAYVYYQQVRGSDRP